MLTENLARAFEKDILKLKAEISSYPDESKLWITAEGISNSGGNLCLHLLGNLQHFIGGVLGGSGYVRNRPEEFSLKNIPVSEMCVTAEHTAQVVAKTIRSLSAGDLEKNYPEKIMDNVWTTEYFLLHLLAHLNYHLGQINYHRRLIG